MRKLLISVLAGGMLLAFAGAAHGFGTINSLGQHAEHERITRAGLWCQATMHRPHRFCWHDKSMDQLAGKKGDVGAVGQPDVTIGLIGDPSAHCDELDYLPPSVDPNYPRTTADRDAALGACVGEIGHEFDLAVADARQVVDDHGFMRRSEVAVQPCDSHANMRCQALLALGRTLHGTEDFYSHSNWGDHAIKPYSLTNPPGLGLDDLAPFFDFRHAPPPPVAPALLGGGCYEFKQEFHVHWDCIGRVNHEGINKDEGHIDPRSGAASSPDTSRGKRNGNFAQAVGLAVREANRQWSTLQKVMKDKEPDDSEPILCSLVHDNPLRDCSLKIEPKVSYTVAEHVVEHHAGRLSTGATRRSMARGSRRTSSTATRRAPATSSCPARRRASRSPSRAPPRTPVATAGRPWRQPVLARQLRPHDRWPVWLLRRRRRRRPVCLPSQPARAGARHVLRRGRQAPARRGTPVCAVPLRRHRSGHPAADQRRRPRRPRARRQDGRLRRQGRPHGAQP